MGATPQEARTVNHIGFASRDRVEQEKVLLRVVFEVRILNNNDLPCDSAEAGAKRRPLSLIFRMIKDDVR
jgi:hypothetical protein